MVLNRTVRTLWKEPFKNCCQFNLNLYWTWNIL